MRLLLVKMGKKKNLLENILIKIINYSFFVSIKNTKYYIVIKKIQIELLLELSLLELC